jgi:predicted transcriptional regulator
MKKWQLKSVKLDAKGLAKFLGERESEVMDIVWEDGCVTVRDVCDKLCEKREYSFNTIMTIMNRLGEKGLLEKSRDGSTFCYKASQEKKSFVQNAIKAIYASLTNDVELRELEGIEK